jgi:hypothetical protein
MSKFHLNLLQISKALYIQKSNFYLEIILLRFRPVRPSPSRIGPLCPQATVHALGPFGLSSLGVFAKRRLFFEFAQSGNDASSLSHVTAMWGPPVSSIPLPALADPNPVATSPRRIRSPRAARPPALRCQSRPLTPPP